MFHRKIPKYVILFRENHYLHSPYDMERGFCIGIGINIYILCVWWFYKTAIIYVLIYICIAVMSRFLIINHCSQVRLGYHYLFGVCLGFLLISPLFISIYAAIYCIGFMLLLFIPLQIIIKHFGFMTGIFSIFQIFFFPCSVLELYLFGAQICWGYETVIIYTRNVYLNLFWKKLYTKS